MHIRTQAGGNCSVSFRPGQSPEPDIGTPSEQGGELCKAYLVVSETNAVANTQYDPADAYPAIVAVEECSVPRFAVLQRNPAVVRQLNAGMEARHRRVFKNQFTGWIPSAVPNLHRTPVFWLLNRHTGPKTRQLRSIKQSGAGKAWRMQL
jgi:hypothetical protein